jgi:glycyl-tRNA synthetase
MTKCFLTGTSIGKRYARTDEIGVPLAVTVDSTTTVTIRERDSKDQVRVEIAEVASIVKQFVEGQSTWGDIQWNYPAVHGSPDETETAPEKA